EPAAGLKLTAHHSRSLEGNRLDLARGEENPCGHVRGMARAAEEVREVKQCPVRQQFVQHEIQVQVALVDGDLQVAAERAVHLHSLGKWFADEREATGEGGIPACDLRRVVTVP